MVNISKKAAEAVSTYIELEDVKIFEGQGNEVTLKLFMPRINGREFDVQAVIDSLIEVVVDFSLSRPTIAKYKNNEDYSTMSQDARSKFREYANVEGGDKGELGELILYTFLEGYLHAPQILSKMAIKTTNKDYTKNSDGIHFFQIPSSEKYHLIFGEAKMYTQSGGGIVAGFKSAFESIANHQNEKYFERSLISGLIDSEFENQKDKELIADLLYPAKSDINVSDAFGIFIGFDFDDSKGKIMTLDDYEVFVKTEIVNAVTKKINTITKYIIDNQLEGKSFYVYLMPFTNMDESRDSIIKGVTK
ncbi:DUF1837 domain-containing protein [Leuconostoc falkenbergense]|uniref:HamA C-terminal domain-containing protein n=1 Tax=Leuconostoc falkenbergense TaxID=2766470 RepID=UPI0021A97C47|nr:DUF1837 domain-containing protein [Leuconostoc falkenbergense]MCT4378161.1 DUF1837 domain-containing protein [Leuconostoc falkenbergense]